MRMVLRLATLALVAAAAPTVAFAGGVHLFSDTFQTGTVCAWDAAIGAEPCDDCMGQPDGKVCGKTLEENCGPCNYGDTCAETGSKSCTCTTYTCEAFACEASVGPCEPVCLRVTEGDPCGIQPCGGGNIRDLCCTEGACTQLCSTCYCPTC